MGRPATDITGRTFAQLRVMHRSGSDKMGRATWVCSCSCGQQCVVTGIRLRTGSTKSCGCLWKSYATTDKGWSRHGQAKQARNPASALYNTWCRIKSRCHNPKNPDYPNYGGRGIEVCPAWRASFEIFAADMGPRPTPSHSIDRVDNERGYAPNNCRWTTHKEQARNRRCSLRTKIQSQGETHSIYDWADKVGISAKNIARRLYLGWTSGEALYTPLRQRGTDGRTIY